jgi:hypothetical protein
MNRRRLLLSVVRGIASSFTTFAFTPFGAASGASSGKQAQPESGELHPAEPLNPLLLPGTHAYAEKWLSAGETIGFRVSSVGPYRLSIVRLGWDVSGPSRDWVLEQFPDRAGTAQPIRPGSYVHIPRALPSAPLRAISLECWVRPWLHKWQGLISQYTFPTHCGFGLFLDQNGAPALYFGDGSDFRAEFLRTSEISIPLAQWSHIVAVFKEGTASLWIDGIFRAAVTGPSAVDPGSAPLRLAAYGVSGFTGNCLDGDLAMPVIYGRALTPSEILARANARPPVVPSSTDLLGCWPLDEEKGQTIADLSPFERTGKIVNRGTWMVGGPGFDATAIDRFGFYDPSADPSRGHGLRFASEDLFDCGWSVTDGYTIPNELPSGIYVGRIQFGEGFTRRYDVTFVVRPAKAKPRARILVLCSTNTWLAYNVPFPNIPDAADWGVGGHGASVPGTPGFNMYDNYAISEVPPYQMGVQMPWSAFPYMVYNSMNYGHLLRAERPLHVWLEQNGYIYDVASDLDVHEPGMLADYDVVVINGHSEYWTTEAYNALDGYLSAGGQVVVLSGNTMFWRVSFDAARDIMECRKLPESVGGRSDNLIGELYHSHDRARGGLMREAGHPAWRVIGLECVGYDGSAGTYAVEAPLHPFFQGPEPLGVSAGQALGTGAVGHEYDVRLTQIPGSFTPAPLPGPLPQSLAQAVTDAPGVGFYFDYRGTGMNVEGIRSEIIDWQRGSGGRVFAVGSIAAGRGLMSDWRLEGLLRNVLHHFGIAHRLNLFTVADDGRIQMKWWDGEAWGPSVAEWRDLGGSFSAPVEAVAWAPDQVALMGPDPNGRLQYKWWDGSEWHPSLTDWTDLGGQLQGRPCGVTWGRNRLNIFARGLDGGIYVKWWDGEDWGPSTDEWQQIGSAMAGPPAAVSWMGDHLSVAAIGEDRRLKYKWWDGVRWNPSITDWLDLGGSDLRWGPVMLSWGGNRINVFVVDSRGGVWTKWWDGAAWGPSLTEYASLGNGIQGVPAVIARGGSELSLFAVGSSRRMQAKWWDGSNWGPSQTTWKDLGGDFMESPAAVAWRGQHVSVMGIGSDGRFHYKYWDGGRWNPSEAEWLDLTGTLSGQPLKGLSALSWVGRR